MRSYFAITTAAVALVAFVAANPEPCSDHPGVVHKKPTHKKHHHHKGSKTLKISISSAKPYVPLDGTTAKKAVPKVSNANASTLKNGAAKVVGQMANKGYIPSSVAASVNSAVSKAINDQLGSVTVTEYVTFTASNAQTSALSAAGLNIKKAIDSAFAAVDFSQSGLTASTVKSLEACLTTVLSSGGMPAGYACLTESGSTASGLQETLGTILGQFVGILPNKILTNLFDAVTPLLTDLLPASELTLVKQIEASIASITATTSAASVQAMQQMQNCYTTAIQQAGDTSSLACYNAGAGNTLATAANAMLESFVGVLPAALTTQVENILAYNTAKAGGASSQLAAQVSAQISNAINSAASTLAGNTVSVAETMQTCITQLMQNGDAAAAKKCLTSDKVVTLTTTMVDGLAEQFAGYLPSSFFSDLAAAAKPLLSTSANKKGLTEAQINAAFDKFFNNATLYGPAYVTCFEQVEACVKKAIVASSNAAAKCAGPVAGCKLTKLASASPSASVAAKAKVVGNVNIKALPTSKTTSIVKVTATVKATVASSKASSLSSTKPTSTASSTKDDKAASTAEPSSTELARRAEAPRVEKRSPWIPLYDLGNDIAKRTHTFKHLPAGRPAAEL